MSRQTGSVKRDRKPHQQANELEKMLQCGGPETDPRDSVANCGHLQGKHKEKCVRKGVGYSSSSYCKGNAEKEYENNINARWEEQYKKMCKGFRFATLMILVVSTFSCGRDQNKEIKAENHLIGKTVPKFEIISVKWLSFDSQLVTVMDETSIIGLVPYLNHLVNKEENDLVSSSELEAKLTIEVSENGIEDTIVIFFNREYELYDCDAPDEILEKINTWSKEHLDPKRVLAE